MMKFLPAMIAAALLLPVPANAIVGGAAPAADGIAR